MEFNDESWPQGAGAERQRCRKFFLTSACFCSTLHHPSGSFFGVKGALWKGSQETACIPFPALRVLSGGAQQDPPDCASTCWTATWRSQPVREDATRGCPSGRRRPPSFPSGSQPVSDSASPRRRRTPPGLGPRPPPPVSAGRGKVEKGRGQTGASARPACSLCPVPTRRPAPRGLQGARSAGAAHQERPEPRGDPELPTFLGLGGAGDAPHTR